LHSNLLSNINQLATLGLTAATNRFPAHPECPANTPISMKPRGKMLYQVLPVILALSAGNLRSNPRTRDRRRSISCMPIRALYEGLRKKSFPLQFHVDRYGNAMTQLYTSLRGVHRPLQAHARGNGVHARCIRPLSKHTRYLETYPTAVIIYAA